jgi:hypothetical protein
MIFVSLIQIEDVGSTAGRLGCTGLKGMKGDINSADVKLGRNLQNLLQFRKGYGGGFG